MFRSNDFTGSLVSQGPRVYGLSRGPIHLDDVICNGDETALDQCTHSTQPHDCSHYEDVAIQCIGNSIRCVVTKQTASIFDTL